MKNACLLALIAALLAGCAPKAEVITPGPGLAKGTAAPTAAAGAPAAPTPAAPTPAADTALRFETTDLDGNAYTEAVFAEASLTMINLWEPWCGPCVGEMPDLQQLSLDYADEGFRILGVFSDQNYMDELYEILEDTGVTYPILHYTSAFNEFQTGYVPTSFFVDGEGRVVAKDYIGGNDYEGWAAIIEALL